MSPLQHSVLAAADAHSAHIGTMWNTFMWVCGFFYLLVLGFLFLALARRRRGGSPEKSEAEPPALRSLLRTWGTMIVVGLAGLALTSYAIDRKLFQSDQGEAIPLVMTGYQWWWSINYENDDPSQSFTTANEIHLPVDTTARIDLHSNDVIHSFWVPNLHGKQDLIPMRNNHIFLHPTKIGRFRGQCAEFCGAQHAKMALVVVVESRADFDRWRQNQMAAAHEPGDPKAAHGKDVFLGASCPLCHTIRGTGASGRTGPDLTHLASRDAIAARALPNTPDSLKAWITHPQAAKPGSNMPATKLEGDSLSDLATYLGSLQ